MLPRTEENRTSFVSTDTEFAWSLVRKLKQLDEVPFAQRRMLRDRLFAKDYGRVITRAA
jgi:hypothetical protein